MKAIIFSDSHGSFEPMLRAVENEEKVDMIIHAGDVLRDVEDLRIMYPRKNIVCVKGNNDFWDRTEVDERVFEFSGVKIFLAHGHTYGVKYTLGKIYEKAVSLGADICIFGHTHLPLCEKRGNVFVFNPGAASKTYGVLEIKKDNNFDLKICEI